MIKPLNGWGSENPPACVDCLHYRPTCEHVAKRCMSERCRTFDRVKGYEQMDPSVARQCGAGGHKVRGPCGPEGTLFEPAPPPTWLQRNAVLIAIGSIAGVMLLRSLMLYYGGE